MKRTPPEKEINSQIKSMAIDYLPIFIGYVEQIQGDGPLTVLMKNCPQKWQGKRKVSKKMLFFPWKE